MSPPPSLHALITDSASIQRYPRQAPLARTTEPPPDAWRIKDFLAKFIFSIFAAFVALSAPHPVSAAGSIDLSTAGHYNTFILGDYSDSSSYTEGRLAVGGNAAIDACTVGEMLDPATAGDVLVVGGDLALTDSVVYYGDVRVGGSATGADNTIGGELTDQGAIPVDFVFEQQYLLDLSATLAAEPANGTYEDR